jgi:DNA-binding IclR family transcriptional regulator
MQQDENPRTVQAVQTACEIVDLLREQGEAGVTELANELDLSKGTVHCQLSTLVQNEFIVKSEEGYQLSLRYLDLGEHVKERLGIYEVVCEEIDDLAEATEELAQFATEEYGQAVYIYKAGGSNAVQTASSIGRREYLHCIALGKAMLACFSEPRIEEIIEYHGLPQFTDHTITTRTELFDELSEIRERGYATDQEEKIEGLHCIATPVMGNQDEVLGAVSVSGPSRRMEGARLNEELPQQVQRSANVVEINAKFS